MLLPWLRFLSLRNILQAFVEQLRLFYCHPLGRLCNWLGHRGPGVPCYVILLQQVSSDSFRFFQPISLPFLSSMAWYKHNTQATAQTVGENVLHAWMAAQSLKWRHNLNQDAEQFLRSITLLYAKRIFICIPTKTKPPKLYENRVFSTTIPLLTLVYYENYLTSFARAFSPQASQASVKWVELAFNFQNVRALIAKKPCFNLSIIAMNASLEDINMGRYFQVLYILYELF